MRPHACLALPCTVIQNEDAFCAHPFRGCFRPRTLSSLTWPRAAVVAWSGMVTWCVCSCMYPITPHSASICASCMVLVKPDPGWNRNTVIR
jgi:hypothetical protein